LKKKKKKKKKTKKKKKKKTSAIYYTARGAGQGAPFGHWVAASGITTARSCRRQRRLTTRMRLIATQTIIPQPHGVGATDFFQAPRLGLIK
jgi:hypothetical protein